MSDRKHLGAPSHTQQGLSLVETSLVLVVVGLIIGGIATGQYLLAAASIRASISQLGKYQAAFSAFSAKYKALPGDMPAKIAAKYGFVARGTHQGQGDGNGVIECWNGTAASGICQGDGETATVWVDLAQAGMVEGGFSNTASETTPLGGGSYNIPNASPNLQISNVLPPAAFGAGNYVYVYSTGGANYFGISYVSSIQTADKQQMLSTPGITVNQAYSIDAKLDDGYPQTGNVTAQYTNSTGIQWPAGGGVSASNAPAHSPLQYALGVSDAEASGGGGSAPFGTPDTSATPSTGNTCYDNGNSGGSVQKYSMGQNSGNNVNCAITVGMQNN